MNKQPNSKKLLFPVLMLATVIMSGVSSSAWALTAANTIIRNQASATFKDDTGTAFSVTSNVVETLVQPVAGVDLTQSQQQVVSTGGVANFAHVLTNTGNANDSFALSQTNLTGDDYDFASISFYPDANQDGQADNGSSAIATTSLLKAGESFAFVAVANIPSALSTGQQAKVDITAQSQFNSAVTANNTDTGVITGKAVMEVTKTMSAAKGVAGSGVYTITLAYRNTSAVAASNVTIIDALPEGMEYVPNSGRWLAGGNTVLTDSVTNDAQGVTPNIQYCAYDPSCIGIAEAQRDADTDPSNQVTAIISEVPAEGAGWIRFNVNIAATVLASSLVNTAEFEYYDGSSTSLRAFTNSVRFDVLSTAGVVVNGSPTDSTDGSHEPIALSTVPAGQAPVFTDYVWNTGNASDTFDLSVGASSFPAGTTFKLYEADGVTPLLDTNNNGIPDTGSLAVGEVQAVVIKAILPANSSAGVSEVTLTAKSSQHSSLTNSAINHIDSITPIAATGGVDLTNNAALGQAGVLGDGNGPESAPVTTRSTLPGTTTRFILYVNNTSSAADNFNLEASTDNSFSQEILPSGWSLKFIDDSGATVSNTGNIAANSSKRIFAEVTVPAKTAVGTTNLYFRVMSANTGAQDIKWDALSIGAENDLALYPDNAGQITAGGTIIYNHWLVNQGNTAQTNIQFASNNDAASWQSVLYEDTDGNGVLSSGDNRLTTISNILPSQKILLFNKVFAPSNSAKGAIDVTSINATWNGGILQAIDVTTLNNSAVAIRKEQALDKNCDGSPETTFSTNDSPAEPNQCVIYQLTATNRGVETVNNVRIQDATPPYTAFITAGSLPEVSKGSIATPISNGAKGKIIGAVGSLASGESANLTFGIKIQ